MIKLKNLNTDEFQFFETTKFPDKTTQVWNISPKPLTFENYQVIWMFENENELFQLCQLGTLLYKLTRRVPSLYMPYLVCGRQDKDVSNNSTFSQETLTHILREFYDLECFDAHSSKHQITSITAVEFQLDTLKKSKPDILCYPDQGALDRYYEEGRETILGAMPKIFAQKVRNQQTGEITGLDFTTDLELKDKKILICDDLCDGGGTFIALAKKLKEAGVKEIDLCVSHGLFTKGKQVLYDAGITEIYTTNSLLNNPEGFKVVDL